MKSKKTNILTTISILFILSVGSLSANNTIEPKKNKSAISYRHLSTSELQKEVEKLATKNKLPFEMGVELLKRWQKKVS